jgi:fumarylacetoacetate (FAA) hydrolase family protein
MREREMLQMLKQAEQVKLDEQRMLEAKKARAQAMIAEVEVANKRAIEVKENRKQEEKDLEQKIVDYNRAKAQREEEKVADLKRIKEEKEREVARLRELQEKAADRQAEIDALRAKRAFEEGERAAREKERRDLEHKQKVLKDMEDARQR